MNRIRRSLTMGTSTLETGVAALAGFLAGHALRDEWPLLERLIAVVLGG